MAIYRVKCSHGYSIMGENPPELDTETTYKVIAKSKYYEYCVLIQRTDEKKYLGNDMWIVPERSLELVNF